MIKIFSACLGLLMALPIVAQDKSQQLEKFVNQTLEEIDIIPGLSVAVVMDAGIVFTKGFGLSNLETGEKATEKTNFYIASSTKAFNGLLATELAAEGRLDLNRDISTYKPFSEFENREVFEGVSVQDLLSHTSGIDNPYLSFLLAYSGDYTDERILKVTEQFTEKNENGKAFEYTNFGYYMFALLLKYELGEDWRELLDQKLFTPCQMDRATAYVSESENRAAPHIGLFPGKVEVAKFKTDKTMHAAGGLLLNAEDAGNFLSLYLNDGKLRDAQIFEDNVILESYAPKADQNDDEKREFTRIKYGNGWNIGTYNDDKVVFHFGGYTGFASHISFMPEQKIGVAVFVNHEIGMPVANMIAEYAYDLYNDNSTELARHEKMLKKKLPSMLEGIQKGQIKHEEKMAARQWQLKFPKESYPGTYRNENFGTVKVWLEDEEFWVACGNMETVATAFPEDNCMRVELVPRSGTIIQFLSEDGDLNKINWRGEIFTRIKIE